VGPYDFVGKFRKQLGISLHLRRKIPNRWQLLTHPFAEGIAQHIAGHQPKEPKLQVFPVILQNALDL